MPPYGLPPPADDVAPRGTKAWRQAVNARRAAVGNSLWTQQARSGLNLSDPAALSAALAQMGITDEIGGGRHMRRYFMGDLPSEGFGMSSPERGISFALEREMPDWKQFRDRAVQLGMAPGYADNAYFPWSGWNTPGGPVDPRGMTEHLPGASSSTAPPVSIPEEDENPMPGMGSSSTYEDPLRRRRLNLGNI